jgi:hypothetical protein
MHGRQQKEHKSGESSWATCSYRQVPIISALELLTCSDDFDPCITAQTTTAEDNEISQPAKKKHAALKLSFRDSMNANRKVSNGGVTISTSDSDTHVGSTTMIGDGKIKKS